MSSFDSFARIFLHVHMKQVSKTLCRVFFRNILSKVRSRDVLSMNQIHINLYLNQIHINRRKGSLGWESQLVVS